MTVVPADSAVRMGLRCHLLVLALFLSDLAVRTIVLARDLSRVDDVSRAGDLPFKIARNIALDSDRDSALDLDRVLALDRALNLAHHVALMVGRALGIKDVRGLAAALLDGVLDDFTRADLTYVDLRGLDLTACVSRAQAPYGRREPISAPC